MSKLSLKEARDKYSIFSSDPITATNWEYKPGNKEFCRSISELSPYYKDVLSSFYISETERRIHGKKWSQCFSQDEALHYCWITIDLELDRDRPLEIYAYTGQSGNIPSRLGVTNHDNFKVAREDKILIHTTKSSDQSHADLVEADEFNELNGKATLQQVEQSNINAIRAVRSIKLLNRKDEDSNRIINPVLFKKIKHIESMVEQFNKKLLKLREVWLDNSLVPDISEEQIREAFDIEVAKWYDRNFKEDDGTATPLDAWGSAKDLLSRENEITLPALEDKIKHPETSQQAIKKATHIMKEIRGCEIFQCEPLGFKDCFKFLFTNKLASCVDSNFLKKIVEIEKSLFIEQGVKAEERSERRMKDSQNRDKGLSPRMRKIKKKIRLKKRIKELEKIDKKTNYQIVELMNAQDSIKRIKELENRNRARRNHRKQFDREFPLLQRFVNKHLLGE